MNKLDKEIIFFNTIEELFEHQKVSQDEDSVRIKRIFNKYNLQFVSEFFDEHMAIEHLSSYSSKRKKHIHWHTIKDEYGRNEILIIQNKLTCQCLISLLQGEENQISSLFENKDSKQPKVDEHFSHEVDEIHPFLYFVHAAKRNFYFFNRIENVIIIINLEQMFVQKIKVHFEYPQFKLSKLCPDEKDKILQFPLYEDYHFESVTAYFLNNYSCIPMYFLFSDQCYDTYSLPARGDGRIYLFFLDSCSLQSINIIVPDNVVQYSHVFLGNNNKNAELIIGVECWLGGDNQEILLTKVDVTNQNTKISHKISSCDSMMDISNLWEKAVSPDSTKLLISVTERKMESNSKASQLFVMIISSGEIILKHRMTDIERHDFEYGEEIYWIDDFTIKFYNELIQLEKQW